MKKYAKWIAAALAIVIAGDLLCVNTRAFGQKEEDTAAAADENAKITTEHSVDINGRKLQYTVTAGGTYIYNLDGEPTASIYSYTYAKKGTTEDRPVLFAFNGGPGAASLWAQLGIGPYEVSSEDELVQSGNGTYEYTENHNSILDVADLVFIDPVGTGYSHAEGSASASDFYNVSADADSIAAFIRQWVNENERWNSKKYILGESYGCTRAAVLANALMGGPTTSSGQLTGISLDGVIMMGVSLQNDAAADQDLTETMTLPTMAATAWYYHKGSSQSTELDRVYQDAKEYAEKTYYPAIQKEQAGTLSAADRQAVAKQLTAFTGLPESTFADSIVLDTNTFTQGLLQSEGQSIGVYDGRYTLPSSGSQYEPVADDAAMSQYAPAFIACFENILKNEFHASLDRPYNSLVWKNLNLQWDYNENTLIPSSGYEYDLAAAMRRNPDMRLFIASGYYDLATPAALAEHIVANAPIDSSRVTVKRYESGHMIYIGSAKGDFLNDLRNFLQA